LVSQRHHHDYWSLVEPFRKDGKNQHNKLFYFGRLTDEELKTINYALDILKNCSIEKPKLKTLSLMITGVFWMSLS